MRIRNSGTGTATAVSGTRRPTRVLGLGNAKRLVARHGENIRYVADWGKWLIWRNERWEIDGDGAIMRLAKETVEAMYPEAMALKDDDRTALLNHAIKSQAEQRLKAMINWPKQRAALW